MRHLSCSRWKLPADGPVRPALDRPRGRPPPGTLRHPTCLHGIHTPHVTTHTPCTTILSVSQEARPGVVGLSLELVTLGMAHNDPHPGSPLWSHRNRAYDPLRAPPTKKKKKLFDRTTNERVCEPEARALSSSPIPRAGCARSPFPVFARELPPPPSLLPPRNSTG